MRLLCSKKPADVSLGVPKASSTQARPEKRPAAIVVSRVWLYAFIQEALMSVPLSVIPDVDASKLCSRMRSSRELTVFSDCDDEFTEGLVLIAVCCSLLGA